MSVELYCVFCLYNNNILLKIATADQQQCLSVEGGSTANVCVCVCMCAYAFVNFCFCDLDLDPMTLIYELDLDILKMYTSVPK